MILRGTSSAPFSTRRTNNFVVNPSEVILLLQVPRLPEYGRVGCDGLHSLCSVGDTTETLGEEEEVRWCSCCSELEFRIKTRTSWLVRRAEFTHSRPILFVLRRGCIGCAPLLQSDAAFYDIVHVLLRRGWREVYLVSVVVREDSGMPRPGLGSMYSTCTSGLPSLGPVRVMLVWLRPFVITSIVLRSQRLNEKLRRVWVAPPLELLRFRATGTVKRGPLPLVRGRFKILPALNS